MPSGPGPEAATGPFVRRADFDRLAARYEHGSRAMSLGQIVPWRRRAIRALAPRPGANYLDVGAGTGELSRALLRAQPHAQVVALDASQGMLAAGRLDQHTNVRVHVADAHRTGLDPAAFDGAVSGFLLRHLTDLSGFMAEMWRVLRPGARLVLLEAHVPPSRPARALFGVYFHGFAWLLGALLTRNWAAHVGLRRSVRDFPGVDAVQEAARRQGFEVLGLEQGSFSGFFVLSLRRPASSRTS